MHERVFQRPQNITKPKEECYLWSLKNTGVRVFSKFHEKLRFYLLIMYLINNALKKILGNVLQCTAMYCNVIAKYLEFYTVRVRSASTTPLNFCSFCAFVLFALLFFH